MYRTVVFIGQRLSIAYVCEPQLCLLANLKVATLVEVFALHIVLTLREAYIINGIEHILRYAHILDSLPHFAFLGACRCS